MKLYRASDSRLKLLTEYQPPQNALLRTRHMQKLARERKYLKTLEEYIAFLKETPNGVT